MYGEQIGNHMLQVQISHYVWPGLTLKLTIQGDQFSKKNFLDRATDQTESARSAQYGSNDADKREVRPFWGLEISTVTIWGSFTPKTPKLGFGIGFPMQTKMLNISKMDDLELWASRSTQFKYNDWFELAAYGFLFAPHAIWAPISDRLATTRHLSLCAKSGNGWPWNIGFKVNSGQK